MKECVLGGIIPSLEKKKVSRSKGMTFQLSWLSL